jgi:glutathione S-transferase
MYELWQTEWCPASRRVRQRMTELGIDYFTRQVPVERDERTLLRIRTGTDTIPVLVTPEGRVLIGEDPISDYLDAHVPVPAEARAHQLKAEKARRRYLEEECTCSQPATHSAQQPKHPSKPPLSASAKN